MEICKRFFIILVKIITFPLIIIIYLIDSNIAARISDNRYNLKDFRPHLLAMLLAVALFVCHVNNIINFDINKIDNILLDLVNFQGLLFALSIAVTTLILTFFKPTELAKKYPKKKEQIFDTVDDLRIVNRIVFITLIFIFTCWLLITTNFIKNSVTLSTLILTSITWSLTAIDSVVRGIFYLVKID